MHGENLSQATDRLLLPFLEAEDPVESQRLLAGLLLDHCDPIINGIIRHKLRLSSAAPREQHLRQDADDIRGEVLTRLIEHLKNVKAYPELDPIGSLAGYVAVSTYNACDKYLRDKYPERRRLKSRVQYLLTHQPGFALWEDASGEWLCGQEAWRDSKKKGDAAARLGELQRRIDDFEQRELFGKSAKQAHPQDLVAGIFRWVGSPLGLDVLVNLLGELWEVREDRIQVEEDETGLDRRASAGGQHDDFTVAVDRRMYLQRLWSEVCQLPIRQRHAVLLNLKDDQGCSAIELFPLLGIAAIRQIAESLEIPADEFAGLWSNLPLDDAEIAGRLGLTRQQVINLRKCARERLSRRTKEL